MLLPHLSTRIYRRTVYFSKIGNSLCGENKFSLSCYLQVHEYQLHSSHPFFLKIFLWHCYFLSWCGVGSTFHVLKKSTWSILHTLIRSSHRGHASVQSLCHHFFTFYFHFKFPFFASAVMLLVRLFRVTSCGSEKNM